MLTPRRLVEAFLEVADDPKDFVEDGRFAKEHFAAHLLIVCAPGINVVGGRQESERAGMQRSVVHTRPTEKDFTMRDHTIKERAVYAFGFPRGTARRTN